MPIDKRLDSKRFHLRVYLWRTDGGSLLLDVHELLLQSARGDGHDGGTMGGPCLAGVAVRCVLCRTLRESSPHLPCVWWVE